MYVCVGVWWQAERLMDEFEDVTSKEKAFMKLWNRFLHRHAILSDFQVLFKNMTKTICVSDGGKR
jgi:hypothetical protein